MREFTRVDLPIPLTAMSSSVTSSSLPSHNLCAHNLPSLNLCAISKIYSTFLPLSPAPLSSGTLLVRTIEGVGKGVAEGMGAVVVGASRFSGRWGKKSRTNLCWMERAASQETCLMEGGRRARTGSARVRRKGSAIPGFSGASPSSTVTRCTTIRIQTHLLSNNTPHQAPKRIKRARIGPLLSLLCLIKLERRALEFVHQGRPAGVERGEVCFGLGVGEGERWVEEDGRVGGSSCSCREYRSALGSCYFGPLALSWRSGSRWLTRQRRLRWAR